MTEKTIGRMNSLLRNHSELLERYTSMFHENIAKYWKGHDDIHSLIEVKLDEKGNIAGIMKDFKFYFSTSNRLVMGDDEIFSEVKFHTEVEGKQLTLMKCFIHYTREFSFDSVYSEDLLDIDYDDSIERKILNKLATAAFDKKIISAD